MKNSLRAQSPVQPRGIIVFGATHELVGGSGLAIAEL
jgi:hypothetical protein